MRSHVSLPISSPAARANLLEGELELTSSSTIETTPGNGESSISETLGKSEDPNPGQDQAYYAAHGRFTSEVIATIDVRAGMTPPTTSNLVPFVDAPLFGEIDLESPHGTLRSPMELPPRTYADRLVAIYWQHLEPVETILDRERFFRSYEALYTSSSALPHTDYEVWLSILNIVFALAVQRHESTPQKKREEEANNYFQRAWAVLRPEIILWKPGSIELVQCLMLMNRFLHCTNNQHKTWVTAGLAIRIAQSMCFQLPEGSLAKDSLNDRRLRQRVWVSCVALDRCVSWSLGRTLAPSLVLLPNIVDSVSLNGHHQQEERDAERLRRELEFHEIGNQIQLAQTQTRLGIATKLGLPRLYQQEEYHAVAVQLDACLNKWEINLPTHLRVQNIARIADKKTRTEGYLLHLRPMLARFYSLKSRTMTGETSIPPSLSDRLLRQWAGMCIEAAQKLISLVIETLEPANPIGILPWWHRIFYLHMGGINFLAAMFEPDLFTESVSQSWQDVLSALRAHDHLSTYVQQCIRTFETLSTRILQARHSIPDASSDVPFDEGSSGSFFDDLFQTMSCDFDSFPLGVDDSFSAIAPRFEKSHW
ncbi:putative transcriptional regulatory protein C757,04 [Talaromyces islandicus]|uniref:Putative transcriptional regulatory protein C757,04 n=1 Tax=Talaromyces islandicus TaxID=28573 RepID=A0A0U1LTG4_TALIS|nr:putative transcriptional regulatory protein C757,04 [Talaromyces islandicus]